MPIPVRVLRRLAKRAGLAAVRAISHRHAVLLPAEAEHDASILSVRAPYRVEGTTLTLWLDEPGRGRLSAALFAYDGHFPTRRVWESDQRLYPGPCHLVFDLASGAVRLDDDTWGVVPIPLPGRRFVWRLRLVTAGGLRSRATGHYVAAVHSTIDERYFRGGTYVDHEAQSAGDIQYLVQLLQRHRAEATVIEVGCATGGLMAALDAIGLVSVGVDTSAWAVKEARDRSGKDRAWICDVERDPIPPEITARAPFRTLVLPSVFEHFNDPFATLGRLTTLVVSGGLLVMTTTNADGLGRLLFGGQWEGYFDPTHFGIDRVSARTLRNELPRLGWRLVELATNSIWDLDADPGHATLRDWWNADARFRRLLAEQERGDLMTCVAVRN